MNITKYHQISRNLSTKFDSLPQNNKVWPIYLDNLTQLIILIQRKRI